MATNSAVGQAPGSAGGSFLSGKTLTRTLQGWVFIGPVVFGTLIFNVLPMIPTIYASFTWWDGLQTPNWIGLDNYKRALEGHDPNFRVSVINTLLYMIGYVPGAMAAGLALALVVNEKLRGITFVRAVFYLPVISSVVAIGVVWKWIFNWQYGLFNAALDLVGILGPRWLTDPNWAMVAVIIVAIWGAMGYNMVLFLAGLQGIPPQLEEAAEIDGAGAWQRLLHVKLPLLTPTIFFVAIMSVISSFQVFGLIFVMTAGGPGSATYVYVYHLWNEGFKLRNFGYGSALAWMLFVVIALITWFQWKMSDRWVHYQ